MEQTATLRHQDPSNNSPLHGVSSRTQSEDDQAKSPSESKEIPWSKLLDVSDSTRPSLQGKLRDNLAEAILEGHIPEGTRLPSTRVLASLLKVARITVAMAYDALEVQGLIVVRERSGHFVAKRLRIDQELAGDKSSQPLEGPPWASYFPALPEGEKRLEKPRQWYKYRFPFVYGKVDQELFPLADWRECSRLAQATPDSGHWSYDAFDGDDRFLIEQLCSNVLPKRASLHYQKRS